MAANNRMARILARFDALPKPPQRRTVTLFVGRAVPYVAGVA